MLGKTLTLLLILNIILTLLSGASAKKRPQTLRKNGNIQRLIAYEDANGEVQENHEGAQAQTSIAKDISSNENIPYAEIHELKKQYHPDQGLGRWQNGKKRPLAMQFKYASSKDEAGFDLTPEEMKKFKIWKDGVIPYYIDVLSFKDKVLRDKIRNFLQMVNSVTSLNFVEIPGPPADDNDRWILFVNRRGLLGCADHNVKNFTNQGVQSVVLGYDCIASRGELAEAVMSIVGVPAQHNAPDRDNYITVNTENIMPDKRYLFDKLTNTEWLFHDLEYDFDSVTHYDIHKYSANGRATIDIKKNADDLNPSTTFTPTDLLKIKMLYNFITRNKKIQASVCEKLFKINSKFSQGGKNNNIKPRVKPSKYLSHGFDESKSYVDIKNENEVNNTDTQIAYDENINTENYEEADDAGQENISDDAKPLNQQILKGTREPAIDSALADDSTKRIPLKLKTKKFSIDPLLAYSDYNTDEQQQMGGK